MTKKYYLIGLIGTEVGFSGRKGYSAFKEKNECQLALLLAEVTDKSYKSLLTDEIAPDEIITMERGVLAEKAVNDEDLDFIFNCDEETFRRRQRIESTEETSIVYFTKPEVKAVEISGPCESESMANAVNDVENNTINDYKPAPQPKSKGKREKPDPVPYPAPTQNEKESEEITAEIAKENETEIAETKKEKLTLEDLQPMAVEEDPNVRNVIEFVKANEDVMREIQKKMPGNEDPFKESWRGRLETEIEGYESYIKLHQGNPKKKKEIHQAEIAIKVRKDSLERGWERRNEATSASALTRIDVKELNSKFESNKK